MLDEIARLARPAVLAMAPYSSARTEGRQEDVSVYLDANESPYPPFPGDDSSRDCNTYPKPQPPELVAILTALFGVSAERLLITRGADEAIDLLVRVFCREGRDAVLVTPPTFPMYTVAAQTQGAHVRAVPLRLTRNGWHRDAELDAPAILAACGDPDVPARIVFICSPNNPTGGLLDRDTVLGMAGELLGRALVVVDEAYLDFSGAPSIAAAIDDHPNLVVLRTLSKEYGLAGERCGITLAHPDVIDLMGRILAPYPIPRSVIRTVVAAMSPEGIAVARSRVAEAVSERRRVEQALAALDTAVIGLFRSDTNYLLAEMADASLLVTMLGDRGIKVRDRSRVAGIEGCVRFSMGTAEQNTMLLQGLREYAVRVTRARG